ncbi:SDR family oxidoreductase [Rhodococcus sp. BP-316]|uniref:SDR family NAD(P)-dependent oxidoreductase n=1 Tax=Rhodococcus sp. BP-316 TaxID=2739445 RepID=UPI001C9B5B70|nr:SDR family NAD(P)-dependent oxidoreductase [Rhodococcus sp. BP-316]MBY6681799.1 SDR family oxidoreductase [Rhodococcus sp. BP-316]
MNDTRVALVTAAAGAGIGRAVAHRLASDGFTVVVTDTHERRAAELAGELAELHHRPMSHHRLDVTDTDAIDAVVTDTLDRFGHIDVLINNAGFSVSSPIVDLDIDAWRKCIDIDLNGTFYCTRSVLPSMVERGTGAIVNLSSTAAWESIPDHGSAYSAAKAGVLALTRVAASEVGRHGIRVNAVAPGLIYNDFLRRIYPDDFFAGFAERRTFLGRLGTPDDVANVISFLASDQAAYVTGEVYGVSGGTAPHA